ncbi:TadE/TadG family type IV pilus assembly protein [Sulfitobacter sp.]|jgi:Flp pilus assembly protein TadG|uniref:TadE/TadG family type IV pilus assembly protein n=1 Tax=Sulfitobacter sp. TaxID=1903071 RepID=UPI003EFA5453
MKQLKHIQRFQPRFVKRFGGEDDGAIIVEFGIVMPIMLLLLALTVEASRLMWSYQSVIAGVRDAGRYMARVTPSDICAGGGSVSGLSATLKDIVQKDINGNALFPIGITVNSVTPSYSCVAGTYRVSPAPVAQVTANVTVQFPLGGLLALFGEGISSVTTDVTDKSRIFGQ